MYNQQATQEQPPKHPSYLFNIEILVDSEHHAAALEQLLRKLNSCDFLDYRILSGIQLGEVIDQHKALSSTDQPIPISNEAKVTSSHQSVTIANKANITSIGFENIRKFMSNNTLIRLLVNKGLGIKLNIPCRIINIDEAEHLITVYHVDEKQVYTFRLNEIEDIVE